jgi:hypothetical protein
MSIETQRAGIRLLDAKRRVPTFLKGNFITCFSLLRFVSAPISSGAPELKRRDVSG